jgi:hypothetical protein
MILVIAQYMIISPSQNGSSRPSQDGEEKKKERSALRK